ncbi:multicopper oxidase domain-containing protein [Psychroserpens jangbogonensis]|uniref:multicopper oxidase domain-containing protein n=1 Tax=Psychroserpens jangbogonensis TaxID=1484460 RepID=UPI000A433034|nr:multicopper oxidase domain-containing protein [Psychroserpens jangbogonensis]
MKKILFTLFVFTIHQIVAQPFTTPLPIPPTLSGPVFNLNVSPSTKQFKPGTITNTFGVNTNYLGPTLLMDSGDFVTINVTNNLSEITTMHWHGMHIPAIDDGGPHSPISPGETWSPDFTVMNKASVYWYHPHTMGLTNLHVSLGIAGFIIVSDPEEAALTLPRTYGVDDIPIVIQTKLLDNDNQVQISSQMDSISMVNGEIKPYVNAPAQMVRFRALNGSSSRTLNIGTDDNRTLYQISSDGGLLENPVPLTRILLSNGERAEFLMDLTSESIGSTFQFKSYMSEMPANIEGGAGSAGHPNPLFGTDWSFMEVKVVTQTASPVTTFPGTMTTLTPFLEGDAAVTRPMELSNNAQINGETMDMNVINEVIELDDIEIWTITNVTGIAHPFHVHDVQFYILDRDNGGGPVPPFATESGLKDTVLVEAGETVRIISKFEDYADEVIPYMYHCHNLIHEDYGMMGQFTVVDSTLGTAEVLNTTVTIFPNPTTDFLNLSIPEYYDVEGIIIFDVNGKEILNISSPIKLIDLSDLSSGVYLLKVFTAQGEVSKKILKD